MSRLIYLDNNAATLIDPKVSAEICDLLQKPFTNPSSVHAFGRQAKQILQNARQIIADYLAIKSQEVVFTSSGTEGMNMLLRGSLNRMPQGHVITSSVEHPCVYATLQNYSRQGWDISFLSPGLWGAVTPEQVKEAIKPTTRLIALMAVNNETGVKTDYAAIAEVAAANQIPFVLDGVALLGKEPFHLPPGLNGACFSGHKIHAPSGSGFCFIRRSLKLDPLQTGGGQEFMRRAGTENLIAAHAIATAINIVSRALPEASIRMAFLRDKLEKGILQNVKDTTVNGDGLRICNTANIAFHGIDGEGLLMALDLAGVCVSHGSACSSGALEPSRILLNMGLSKETARSSLRFSLSRLTTEAEIDKALNIIVEVSNRQYRRL